MILIRVDRVMLQPFYCDMVDKVMLRFIEYTSATLFSLFFLSLSLLQPITNSNHDNDSNNIFCNDNNHTI